MLFGSTPSTLRVAAGSPCAIASAAPEHLQSSNLFLQCLSPSWEPSARLLKEEALEFGLSEIPSCREEDFLLQALAGQFRRPVIAEENAQTNTSVSAAI